jgi:hypothetical protein
MAKPHEDIAHYQVAKNINKWNTKQSELAKPVDVQPAVPKGMSDVNKIGVAPRTVSHTNDTFADARTPCQLQSCQMSMTIPT